MTNSKAIRKLIRTQRALLALVPRGDQVFRLQLQAAAWRDLVRLVGGKR